MKSKARRKIEKWVTQTRRDRKPFYAGPGDVFVFPSLSGEFTHHVVCRVVRTTPSGKEYVEWVCSCPAWFHNEVDQCRHDRDLAQQWAKGEKKLKA